MRNNISVIKRAGASVNDEFFRRKRFNAKLLVRNAAAYLDFVNQHGWRELLAGDRINDWWWRVGIWLALQINHFNAILTEQQRQLRVVHA